MHVDTEKMLISAPTGRARMWRNTVIVLFLLYQVIMPLRYYLGDEEADERFSWRMFSSVNRRICEVVAYETVEVDGQIVERSLDLEAHLQIFWVNILRRYHQPDLVRKILKLRCEQVPIRKIRFDRTCTEVDGSSADPYRMVLDCRSDGPCR